MHETALPETSSQTDSAVHPPEQTKSKGRRWSLSTVQKLSSPNFGSQNEDVKIVNLRLTGERNFSHIYRTRELSFTLIIQRGLYDQAEKKKKKNALAVLFMGHRFTRILTYLHLPIMSQEAMKRLFKPSENWLTFKKTLGNPTETPSKKRKRESEDQRQDPSRAVASAVRHPKLTNYDPWHPSDQFQRQQKGNPALLLQPKSSHKFRVYPSPLKLAFNGRPGRYIAIDCEMVEVTGESSRPKDALARVSAVNYYGYPLLDLFVTPKGRVTDFRTNVSGIRPSNIIYNPNGKYSPITRHRVDI